MKGRKKLVRRHESPEKVSATALKLVFTTKRCFFSLFFLFPLLVFPFFVSLFFLFCVLLVFVMFVLFLCLPSCMVFVRVVLLCFGRRRGLAPLPDSARAAQVPGLWRRVGRWKKGVLEEGGPPYTPNIWQQENNSNTDGNIILTQRTGRHKSCS